MSGRHRAQNLGEDLVASAWIVLGVAAYLASLQIREFGATTDAWGPRIFPQVVSVVLVLGGAWMLIAPRILAGSDGFASHSTTAVGEDGSSPSAPPKEGVQQILTQEGPEVSIPKTLGAIAIVLLYVVILPIFGYVISTVVAGTAMLINLEVRRWRLLFLFPVGLALALYWSFGTFLGVRLP